MAKKIIRKRRTKEEMEADGEGIRSRGLHMQQKVSIGVFLLGVFIVFALFGMSGAVGNFVFDIITSYLGIFAYLLPFLFFYLSYLLIKKNILKILELEAFILSIVLGSMFVLGGFIGASGSSISGSLGAWLALHMGIEIGVWPSVFIFSFFILGSLAFYFQEYIADAFSREYTYEEDSEDPSLGEGGRGRELELTENDMEEESGEVKRNIFVRFFIWLFSLFSFNKEKNNLVMIDGEHSDLEMSNEQNVRDQLFGRLAGKEAIAESLITENSMSASKNFSKNNFNTENSSELNKKEDYAKPRVKAESYIVSDYERPPLNLYDEDSGKPSAGDNKENARLIKRTMQNFGISVEMDEVSVGPTVTRYCLKPAQGVKLSKIAALDKNLAMELSTTNVRIEAPIPGRSVVGIEIPNKSKANLGIGTLFENPSFAEDKTPLLIAIGKDISGAPIYANLAKIPHLLIAGTTGSGKSVMIHTLIQSLIYRNSPADLKFIMIDPKKVELAFYNKLPHLYTNVIKEPKKAIQTLNWLVQEMERRYEVLEEHGKQNIAGYHASVHEKIKRAEASKRPVMEELPEKMPYIVLIIDELADFMMAYPKEMESGIVRLAQKSRAVGIHLILSTQKPLATIISSVIKANVPGRIALKVSSRMDSMVILDNIGAEKLLGNGDLLFMNSDGSDIKRIQSPNVTDKEVVRVVDYLKNKYDKYTTEELKLPEAGGNGNMLGSFNMDTSNDKDDRYEEAKAIILQTKNTSITNLQRKMGVGYARAAKLVDMLEASGVIGKQNGSKPREILVDNSANRDLNEDEYKGDEEFHSND